jgi:hypothetical protein
VPFTNVLFPVPALSYLLASSKGFLVTYVVITYPVTFVPILLVVFVAVPLLLVVVLTLLVVLLILGLVELVLPVGAMVGVELELLLVPKIV